MCNDCLRSFNYRGYKVSHGCVRRQIKANTKELEAIYQGHSILNTACSETNRKWDVIKYKAYTFVQDSQLVQLVCKDSNQQESVVKELEDKSGEKNFYLADPGFTNYFISLSNVSLKTGLKSSQATENNILAQ